MVAAVLVSRWCSVGWACLGNGHLGLALCQTLPMLPRRTAGFDAEVRKANESDIGKRNGGAMLSMQVQRAWQAHVTPALA